MKIGQLKCWVGLDPYAYGLTLVCGEEAPLAVCILTGVMVTISKNRGRFPDIWLKAAESMSQMCESLCRREVDEMRDCTGII